MNKIFLVVEQSRSEREFPVKSFEVEEEAIAHADYMEKNMNDYLSIFKVISLEHVPKSKSEEK
jgi:hypothetical protein